MDTISRAELTIVANHETIEALRASNAELRALNQRLRQEAEVRVRQLAARDARIEAFFAHSLDWLSLFRRDRAGDFRYVDLNQACADAYGMERSDVVGRRLQEILGDAQSVLPLHHMREAVGTGAPQRYQARRTLAGRTRVIDVVFVPIIEAGEPEKLILSTARDLTEREELEEQLRQALKMEAVGHLTGGVAHDFNNLLTVMLANLELVQRRSDEPAIRRLAATAEAAGRRGSELIGQLLAFSRRQMLRPEIVDLRVLLAESKTLLRRVIGETHHLSVRVADDLWSTRIDPTQFQTAMMNLVVNARDAMPGGGEIGIVAENLPPGIEPGFGAAGAVDVRVADHGVGMSAEVAARVFEPFYTTKPVGKGSGLGLSMVQGFVSQSGGMVRIASALGAGTTVRLLLPRSGGAAVDTAADPAGTEAADADPAAILFVEDDAAVRDAGLALLGELGHRVAAARGGPEAIGMLRAGVAADVLITDVVMPGGMDGAALAGAARQIRPGIKVLLMSGYAAPMGTGRHEEFAFIPKPFDSASLQDALRRVLLSQA